MIDREALAAALEKFDDWNAETLPYGSPPGKTAMGLLSAAARERLAQLPPYPPALVELIAKAIQQRIDGFHSWPKDAYAISEWSADAIAVLDALNGETL